MGFNIARPQVLEARTDRSDEFQMTIKDVMSRSPNTQLVSARTCTKKTKTHAATGYSYSQLFF